MVLGSQDPNYIGALLDYVGSSEYGRMIQIIAFSNSDALVKHVEAEKMAIDLIVAEAPLLEELLRETGHAPSIPMLVLSDSGYQEGATPAIHKYQPLHEFLEYLLEHLQGNKSGGSNGQGDPFKVPVIAVYSAAGGSGKSTVALQLSKQLAVEGARVFYLNLELFSGEAIQQAGTNHDGLAQLLYEIQVASEAKGSLDIPISKFISRHKWIDVDTFAPISNLREMMEMGESDLRLLLDYIAGSGEYDLIIVDSDSHPNERTKGLLQRADKLLWILTDDEEALSKTAVYLDFIERMETASFASLMKKTIFVLNRSLGNMKFPLPRAEMAPVCTLSNIPEWKQAGRAKLLTDTPLFHSDILKLIRTIFGGKARVREGSAR